MAKCIFGEKEYTPQEIWDDGIGIRPLMGCEGVLGRIKRIEGAGGSPLPPLFLYVKDTTLEAEVVQAILSNP